jgi:hypothetical protein
MSELLDPLHESAQDPPADAAPISLIEQLTPRFILLCV